MAGSSQPHNFFAAECTFADFAIPLIFYPVIKTMKVFVHIIWVLTHSDIFFFEPFPNNLIAI